MVGLTSTKKAAILAEVIKHPDVDSTNDVNHINRLIDGVALWVAASLHLPRYPEKAKGYSQGDTSPTTDLSSLDSNTLYVSVNGSGYLEIELTLANCTTGALTAAELQTQIQAEGTANDSYTEFDEVTVSYVTGDSPYYLVTSGRYGESSAINITYPAMDEKHVCQSMKFSEPFGGTEACGGITDNELDAALIELCIAEYLKTGVEHASSASMGGGLSVTPQDMPKWVRNVLTARRRGWTA